jgi:hypothetical protein
MTWKKDVSRGCALLAYRSCCQSFDGTGRDSFTLAWCGIPRSKSADDPRRLSFGTLRLLCQGHFQSGVTG